MSRGIYEQPHKMRIGDIACEHNHKGDPYTPDMHIPCGPNDPPITRQPAHIVRRGMCYKSGGNVDVCRECPAQCCFGRRMMQLEEKVNGQSIGNRANRG